jgi:predicted aspartyl protease
MLTGSVNARREAIIRLMVGGPNGQQEIAAVIDTGFNGFLTMPLTLLTTLGCPFNSQGYTELGDGRVEVIDIYEITVD